MKFVSIGVGEMFSAGESILRVDCFLKAVNFVLVRPKLALNLFYSPPQATISR